MKTDSGGSEEKSGKKLGSAQDETRTCAVCGTKFFATSDSEFCPVCILRGAFAAESAATGKSGSLTELPTASSDEYGIGQFRRFENYEVILDEAGRPMELGRGAMGVNLQGARCRSSVSGDSEGH